MTPSEIPATADPHVPVPYTLTPQAEAYLRDVPGASNDEPEAGRMNHSTPAHDALSPEELAELDAQARDEAIYDTEAEQRADAVEAEAESILQAEAARYMTDTYIIPGADGPEASESEPEAGL